jgi:hypothetical protein
MVSKAFKHLKCKIAGGSAPVGAASTHTPSSDHATVMVKWLVAATVLKSGGIAHERCET